MLFFDLDIRKVAIVFLLIILGFFIFFLPDRGIVSKPKVVVIGIDGATWNAIIPLINQDKLPNFKKMMNEGSYGNLTSNPPISPPSWTSLSTGMTPENHGIETFYVFKQGELEPIPVNSMMVKTKTVWELLSENGFKVGVNNWLVTWPPKNINGL